MPKHVDPETRLRIIEAVSIDGMAIEDAAKTFLLSERTIVDVLDRYYRAEATRLRQEKQELFRIIRRLWQRRPRREKR